MPGIPLLDLFQGYATAETDAAQAEQARIGARNAGIAATEQVEQSQYQLARTLGNIDSLQTARGVSTLSPTSQAASNLAITNSNRNEQIARFGDLQQQQYYQTQARGYTTAEEWAIPLAAGQAVSDGVQGFSAAGGFGG